MTTKLTEGAIMKSLDWTYLKAINGLPGMDTAQKLADDYYTDGTNIHQSADSLIRWQIAKAGTTGFVTGLGGIITMPVTIPTNIATIIYLQTRMIAAIAHMGGHDVNNDRVKSLVYACLAGNAAKDILKETGILIGTKMTTKAIGSISGKTLTAINQKVGFRLLTKFGEKGVVNLGKTVPIVGGLIGGTFDSVTTKAIGNIAKTTFIGKAPT